MNAEQTVVGVSPCFQSLMRSVQIVAQTDVTVLITGETGSGKEVVARTLQQESKRADRPFTTLNCAALPESLAESELFGHVRGAFSGAISKQIGKLQATDGGTLFLDEIDSLALPVQAKLLRFLESGDCQPIGQTRTERVNVRIIAATNNDLCSAIQQGRFREDLYFRINVVPLSIPPLRERDADIDRLTAHFINHFSDKYALEGPRLCARSMATLRRHPWPGNVRELRNLCERLTITRPGEQLAPADLGLNTRSTLTGDAPDQRFRLPETGLDLQSLEINLIHQALQASGGNRSKSARLLGMTRDKLLYRIEKYGIAV